MWIGHGKHYDGDLKMVTSDTDSKNGRLTATLGARELAEYLQQTEDWAPDLKTALIYDVCRTTDQAFEMPGSESDWEKSFEERDIAADVEAYSTEHGTEAWTDPASGRTRYTNAFIDELKDASRDIGVNKISLVDLLTKVTKHEAVADQTPPEPDGEGDIVLHDPNDLSVEIQVVDSRTGDPIAGAKVEFQGRDVETAPAIFDGLGRSENGYNVKATAPGYFYRREQVALDRVRSGDALQIPLAREFMSLEGVVRLPDGDSGAIEVKVTGNMAGMVDGYHTASYGPMEAGRFRLKIPYAEGDRTLLFRVNGVQRMEVPFNLATKSPKAEEVRGGSINVYDFGIKTLPPSDRAADWASVEQAVVGGIALDFDWKSMTEADFSDSNGWFFYSQASAKASQNPPDYARAESRLEAMLTGSSVNKSARPALETLKITLGVAAKVAEGERFLDQGDLDRAITVLEQSGLDGDGRIKPKLHSWLLQSAKERRKAKQFAAAIARLDEAIECEPSSETMLDALARQTRLEWIEHAYDRGEALGQWGDARTVVELLASNGAKGASQEWAERVERESISTACRGNYNAALDARRDANPEESERLFYEALDDSPNKHYTKLIQDQLKGLSQELFEKYYSIANELEVKQDFAGAMKAYLRSGNYKPDFAKPDIESVLQRPSIDAADRDKAETFLAGRKVVGEYRQALADGKFDRANTVLRMLSSGAVGIFELEQLRGMETEAREQFALSAIQNLQRYSELSQQQISEYRRFFESNYLGLKASGLEFKKVTNYAGTGSPWVISYTHVSTGVEFVLVPGGSLRMGSDDDANFVNEMPVKDVYLSPYLMARTELSRRAWNGSTSTSENSPVVNISHARARQWCLDHGMELPTEAQWEWAALAGEQRVKGVKIYAPSIDDVTSMTPSNALGLEHMLGNVSEWCLEAYQSYENDPAPFSGERTGQPTDPSQYVVRGGDYTHHSALTWHVTRRVPRAASSDSNGFRPIITLATLSN
ncbi:MAG: tetratricopeptide (TPR) repeat protein [Planctomycetota bacterium]